MPITSPIIMRATTFGRERSQTQYLIVCSPEVHRNPRYSCIITMLRCESDWLASIYHIGDLSHLSALSITQARAHYQHFLRQDHLHGSFPFNPPSVYINRRNIDSLVKERSHFRIIPVFLSVSVFLLVATKPPAPHQGPQKCASRNLQLSSAVLQPYLTSAPKPSTTTKKPAWKTTPYSSSNNSSNSSKLNPRPYKLPRHSH